jgi:tetratricopeptide (TPR) repeat protein
MRVDMAKRANKKKKSPGKIQEQQPVEQQPADRAKGFARFVPGWKLTAQFLVLAAAVFLVFSPAFHGDWLWDDDTDITANPLTKSPTGLWAIWFQPGVLLDYYPVKASVQWLEWQLWNDDPLGYHLTNVVLHVVGACLVWKLLAKLGVKFAWLGGLIFAVHPVNVESVAWIAELKNTLSLPPFLLAMCAWIDYDGQRRKRDYFLSLGLFIVAMFCKPTMVTFPVIILLYAWWKRRKIGWSDLQVSLPFFAVSLAVGALTLWIQQDNVTPAETLPTSGLSSRLALGGLSIAFYFFKCVWPMGLLPIYPRWVVDPPTLVQFWPWPLLIGVIGWSWTRRADWGRHVLLGFGFFLITLLLFAGFTTVAYMRFTLVMDHFLYIPIIGLIGLAMGGWGWLNERMPPLRPYVLGVSAIIVGILAFGSYQYASVFVNQEAYWTYTLASNPDAWPAHNNLGEVYRHSGRIAEAKEQYEEALKLNPNYAEAHNNLGIVLAQTGQTDLALAHYHEALRINPNYAAVHNNMGAVLIEKGQVQEAIEEYQAALSLNPNFAEVHNNLGNAFFKTGHPQEAVVEYERALAISPKFIQVYANLGNVLLQSGHPDEAIEWGQRAVRIDPGGAQAHYNLANILLNAGHPLEALNEYQETLAIEPNSAAARNNLGICLSKLGRNEEAMAQFEEVLRIDPQSQQARDNLALMRTPKPHATPKP